MVLLLLLLGGNVSSSGVVAAAAQYESQAGRGNAGSSCSWYCHRQGGKQAGAAGLQEPNSQQLFSSMAVLLAFVFDLYSSFTAWADVDAAAKRLGL
jgi:hypothetical protein